jgi:tetratricopeptide (TPR) repeat protein
MMEKTMRALAAAVVVLGCLAAAGPAWAVFSGDMSPRAESGDADYAEAIRARGEMDWDKMIAALDRVVARRPWHDNAHSLLGYGHRKLGDYDKALHHYNIALELNPRHRDALNYMGVAYLSMDKVDMAEETLARLATVCQTVALTFSDGDFTDGCNEYRDLAKHIAFYAENGFVDERCPEDWH